jgi:hypothetical protein
LSFKEQRSTSLDVLFPFFSRFSFLVFQLNNKLQIGLSTEGIFEKPGNPIDVKTYRHIIDSGKEEKGVF